MLGRLEFCKKWISWIKLYLESTSVSVLVNGSPTRDFFPKKGLRQGDPLALFLFLKAAQGITGFLRSRLRKKLLRVWRLGVRRLR